VRRTAARRAASTAYPELGNEATTPLFIAAADATEEAIANSLLMAEAVTSRDPATGETRRAVAVDAQLVKRLLSRR
jgi:D-aminopeptidase